MKQISSTSSLIQYIRDDSLIQFGTAIKGVDVNSLVKKDTPNFPEEVSFSPPLLSVASYYGSEQIARLILGMKANVNILDSAGRPPSFFAAMNGNVNIFSDLCRSHTSLLSSDSVSALHVASSYGKIEMIKYILDNKLVDIDHQDNQGITPLICSITSNQIEAINILVSYGADINLPDYKSRTPTHYLAEYIHDLSVIKSFLENPTISISEDAYCLSPLHVAAFYNNDIFINLYYSTNQAFTNTYDESPLHIAIKRKNKEAAAALLPHSDINSQNSNGYTPLHWAVDQGIFIDELINAGCQLDIQDENGWTPLYIAVVKQRKNGITSLRNANPNIHDNLKRTPLIRAVYDGYYDGVLNLLSVFPDIDVNARTLQNETAVMIAAKKGFDTIVDVLLKQPDIDLAWTNEDGKRALDLAQTPGSQHLIEAFMKK